MRAHLLEYIESHSVINQGRFASTDERAVSDTMNAIAERTQMTLSAGAKLGSYEIVSLMRIVSGGSSGKRARPPR